MVRPFPLARTSPPARAVAAVGGVTLTILLLAACSGDGGPSPAPSVSEAAPTPAASTPPGPPKYDPRGTAADNLPLFTQVAEQVWGSPQSGEGRAYVDALAAAGFDKSDMQVSEDLSTIGNAAEALQFSVQFGDECLLGQAGPVTGRVVTTVGPALASGGCLLGETRPIDW
ncbi:DUF6993 domain-containing protein [Microbacterium wangruii]|uniref:DUF6993 domain-containing protein n=1 Tax=Microbacterium wangruii TaxID=3049073 RepID=UPI00256EB9C1|nr:hypothetical protein [Microbacterium sp. zg-Y1211]MDL5486972.1 hypothetical protein [Microbacterium sp. zg-Y1211]